MPDVDTQLAAATAYQDVFVPALFDEWPPRVADAARIRAGQRVLDVACGPGTLARVVASRVGLRGSVSGLDANPGMLAVARRLAPQIDWRLGQAESLPYPDASFDAVVSQFGLMFFSDRVGALREMQRVLAPGGRLAVAVWASLDDTPAYAREAAIVEREAGPEAGAMLRSPFALGDRAELARLFAEAGMRSAHIATHRGRGRFSDLRSALLADLQGWLPLMGVTLPDEAIQRVLKAAETEMAEWVAADGTLTFDSPAHIVAAERAHR